MESLLYSIPYGIYLAMSYELLTYPEQKAIKWLKANGGLAFYGKIGMVAAGVINSRTKPRTWLMLVQKGYMVARPAQDFQITKKK